MQPLFLSSLSSHPSFRTSHCIFSRLAQSRKRTSTKSSSKITASETFSRFFSKREKGNKADKSLRDKSGIEKGEKGKEKDEASTSEKLSGTKPHRRSSPEREMRKRRRNSVAHTIQISRNDTEFPRRRYFVFSDFRVYLQLSIDWRSIVVFWCHRRTDRIWFSVWWGSIPQKTGFQGPRPILYVTIDPQLESQLRASENVVLKLSKHLMKKERALEKMQKEMMRWKLEEIDDEIVVVDEYEGDSRESENTSTIDESF